MIHVLVWTVAIVAIGAVAAVAFMYVGLELEIFDDPPI